MKSISDSALNSQVLSCRFNGPAKARYLNGQLVVFGDFSQLIFDQSSSTMHTNMPAENIAWLRSDKIWDTTSKPIGLSLVHDVLQTRDGLLLAGPEGLESISTSELACISAVDTGPAISGEKPPMENLTHVSPTELTSVNKGSFGALIKANSLSVVDGAGEIALKSQKYRPSSMCVHNGQLVVGFVEKLECAYKSNDPFDEILEKKGFLGLPRYHEHCQSVVLVWNSQKQNYEMLGEPLVLDIQKLLSFKNELYALTSTELYQFVEGKWEVVRIDIYGQSSRFNTLRAFKDKLYICGHRIKWPNKNWMSWCGVYEYDPVSGEERPLNIVGDVRDILFANNSELVMGSEFKDIGTKEHFKGVFVTKHGGQKYFDQGVFPNPKHGAGMSLEHVEEGGDHFALATISTKSEHVGGGQICVSESVVCSFKI